MIESNTIPEHIQNFIDGLRDLDQIEPLTQRDFRRSLREWGQSIGYHVKFSKYKYGDLQIARFEDGSLKYAVVFSPRAIGINSITIYCAQPNEYMVGDSLEADPELTINKARVIINTLRRADRITKWEPKDFCREIVKVAVHYRLAYRLYQVGSDTHIVQVDGDENRFAFVICASRGLNRCISVDYDIDGMSILGDEQPELESQSA